MSSMKEFFYWAWFSPGRDFAHVFWEGDGGFDQAAGVAIYSIMLVGVIVFFYRMFKFTRTCIRESLVGTSQGDVVRGFFGLVLAFLCFLVGWAGFTWTTNALLLGLIGIEWRGIYINFF